MGRTKIPMKKMIDMKITKDATIKNPQELSIILDEDESISLTADDQERLPYEESPTSTIDDSSDEYNSSESEDDLFEEKTVKAEEVIKRKLELKEELPEQESDLPELSADIARANRKNRRLQRSTARSRDLGSAIFPSLPKISPQTLGYLKDNNLPLIPPVRFQHVRPPPLRSSSPPAIRFPVEPVPKFVKENSPPLLPPASDRNLQSAPRPYLPPEQSTYIRIKPRNGDENEALSSKSSPPKKLDG